MTWSELAAGALFYAVTVYVVHPPRRVLWGVHLLAALFLVEGVIGKIRSGRSLPGDNRGVTRPATVINPRRLEFSAAPKKDYGSDRVLLILPGFALAGAVALAYSLYSLTIGEFAWSRLSILIVPGGFLLIGAGLTWDVGRQLWTTRRVLRDPVAVIGLVTKATSDGLHYRFRDLAGIEHAGEGTEYSGDYYEEMEVPVVYERDNPKNNLPVSALYDEYEVSVKLL